MDIVQIVILGLIILLMISAILWIGFRVFKQWNKPNKQFEARMADIQQRKRELGIDAD